MKVRTPVTVQEGLCVVIPCEFTYKKTTERPRSPRGYWFIKDTKKEGPAVASNDDTKVIYKETKGRFRLVGNVTRRDCSLRIDDVRSSDARSYYFRYEHSPSSSLKYSYKCCQLQVKVADLQDKPTIDLPPALTEGTNVSINCTAPGRCSGTPPNITWYGDWNFAHATTNRSVTDANGAQTHISEISFQVTREDNRKQLICTATFYTAGASTKSNSTLNVEYPPGTPTVNVSITDRERDMRTTNATPVEVLEGSKCILLCIADSNPLSNLTWRKGELILKSTFFSNDLKLTRRNITSKDDGVYHCTAANKHGQEQSLVNVSVQCQLSERENNSTEKILEGRSITMKCSVESSPLASLTWMKVGHKSLIELDTLSQNSLTLSLPHVTPETDGQYLCVAENQHGVVNSSVFITVESADPQAASIMPMIGGGLAGIVVLAGISLLGWLFVQRVRRTKNGNNGMGNKEEMVDDDTLIYSEILKPPQSPIAAADHGAENKPGSDVTSTERKEDLYENFREDNLQYASIDFSNLKPGSKATAAPEETLYSEVKLH
ncbi:sialic acid-binding Ig-like lectin 13 isoform X2 [Lissotriton helveticus]